MRILSRNGAHHVSTWKRRELFIRWARRAHRADPRHMQRSRKRWPMPAAARWGRRVMLGSSSSAGGPLTMTNALCITNHPAHRLRHLGAAALSTPELLAVVLG